MADSLQLNVRVSPRTKYILTSLAKSWRCTMAQTVAILADRAAQAEDIDASPSALQRQAKTFVSPKSDSPTKDEQDAETDCKPFEAD